MQLWNGTIPYYNKQYEFMPYMTPYIVDGANVGVVVCPGGAYYMRADHEGKEYAEWLNSIGISAVVLEYRVSPYKAPIPLVDAQRAIKVARYELGKLGVKKIGIMGSSAGGHLAAAASVHYDKQFYDYTDEIDNLSAKPDFTILCYPVIDMIEFLHNGTRVNLLGDRVAVDDKLFYSLHRHVTKDTPPTFLWHTAADQSVPVQNSLLYAMALADHLVPLELHIYPYGNHGLGLAKKNTYVHEWSHSLERWLTEIIKVS